MTLPVLGFLGGTGPQGAGLALRFTDAGYRCLLGSRDPERARARADELGGGDRGGEGRGAGAGIGGGANADIAERADVVFVTLPYDGQAATLEPLRDVLDGKVVVSMVNALSFDARGPYWRSLAAGSAAEEAQQILAGSRVVAAGHTLSASRLAALGEPLAGHVPVCADDEDARAVVVGLFDELSGLRGVHAGALRLSFACEAMTALIVAVNRRYRRSAGLAFTNLPDAALDSGA